MLAQEFDAALAMIDTARWKKPALKLRVLLHVKTVTELDHEHGAEIGTRTVAAALCTSIRSAGVILDALVDDGVLVIRAPAAGRRAVTYAIEPKVARWRVPWSVEPETVAMRLDLVAGRLVEAVSAPEPAFARVTGRAQPWISRVTGRAQMAGSARDGARANGRSANTPGRAQTDSGDGSTPTCLNSSLSREQSSDAAEGVGERVDALKRAVHQRTGASVYGQPHQQLIDIARAHVDLDPLLAWIRRYPYDGHGPPLVVDALVLQADELAARTAAPPLPAPAAEPDEPKVPATPEQQARVAELLAGVLPGRPNGVTPTCENATGEGRS